MSLKMVRCSVLGAKVACLTDLNGDTVRVLCTAHEESTAICRLKHGPSRGGPLSQLLERRETTSPPKDRTCHLRGQ
jgi:hypothetical protein